MTYLHFINLFNQYDREQRFSDGASRLYIKLLDVANESNRNRPKGAPWVVDFQRSDGYVAGVCGWSVNTVKKHRQELEKRKLVSGDFGQVGRNASGKYHLCHPDENLSTSDTISPENLSTSDTIPKLNLSNVNTINPLNLSTFDTISPENELNLSRNLSNVDTLYIEEEKEESSTASAATPPSSFSVEKSEKPKPTASRKKAAAHADEVAALDLPHPGTEFAQLWAEFRAMPKQVKKPVTSLRRLLATLGKYEEGFAQLMLEKAIEGNWSGVEFDGTAKTYAEWRAAQAERLRRQPVRTNSGTNDGPDLNHEFIAEVAAREQAEQDAHFARWQEHLRQMDATQANPDALFGYTQSAAEGLAQARDTPEYRQYLAEQAADEQPANEQPADEQTDEQTDSAQPDDPPDSPQDTP